MRNRMLVPCLVACGVVAAVGAIWVRAGDLRPPAGPIAPTMKTLDQISAQIAALQAPIRQVVRGVIQVPKDQREASAVFAPAVNPARCVVLLSDSVATGINSSYTANIARTGACVASLTATQVTIRVDSCITMVPMEVGYQIIEYN